MSRVPTRPLLQKGEGERGGRRRRRKAATTRHSERDRRVNLLGKQYESEQQLYSSGDTVPCFNVKQSILMANVRRQRV